MKRLLHVGSLVLLGSFVAGSATSAPSDLHRYPYDPVCTWGRIADGHGMIVRCLTEDEAQRLQSSTAEPAKDVSPSPNSSTSAAGPSSTPPVETLRAELLSVVPEAGELPLAQKKLSVPLDRYATCVQDHGGLQGATGQVVVKFLVRERGRAEGAIAEKYQGITEAAARCIADVVDRRPTGTPDAPMVGASATIRIHRKAKP